MITKKEYLEAKMIIALYESQQNISDIRDISELSQPEDLMIETLKKIEKNRNIPSPPEPPPSRYLKEGEEPPKPKNYR